MLIKFVVNSFCSSKVLNFAPVCSYSSLKSFDSSLAAVYVIKKYGNANEAKIVSSAGLKPPTFPAKPYAQFREEQKLKMPDMKVHGLEGFRRLDEICKQKYSQLSKTELDRREAQYNKAVEEYTNIFKNFMDNLSEKEKEKLSTKLEDGTVLRKLRLSNGYLETQAKEIYAEHGFPAGVPNPFIMYRHSTEVENKKPWDSVSEREKQVYIKEYEKQKAKYHKIMSPEMKILKEELKATQPKKPRAAKYDYLAELRQTSPNEEKKNLSKELDQLWTDLPAEEKAKYEAANKKMVLAYQADLLQWIDRNQKGRKPSQPSKKYAKK